jgi:hypothetical protein
LKIRRDIRKSRCTTSINDTGGKFSTIFASAVDIGGKFATDVNDAGGKQWEQLKMNLKKNYLCANSTTQRCPKEIIKIFLVKDFFHLPLVSTTP